MVLDMFQNYLTNDEASHIMQALDNRIRFQNGQNESPMEKHCSHLHEKEFLNKHDRELIEKCRNRNKNINVWYVLQRRIKFLSAEDPSLAHVEAELLRLTTHMNYTEALLFCANLLIDFHFDFNCSEYMPLALKLYLEAFKMWKFFDHKDPSIILSYLKYIFASNYKYQRKLYIGYIEEFFSCYRSYSWKDNLFLILEEVFDLSNKLDYDFFSLLKASKKEYIQKSILENCERFIILARHGFVDRYYENAVRDYRGKLICINDEREDPFGFKNLKVQENNNVMYRSIQVVFLYLKYIYGKELDDSRVIGDQTLRLVWETTPDPFLSKSQFLGCFEELPVVVQPRLHDAWNWYQETVMTAPRSLKHSSRSAIHQRLTACSQFPEGVQSLKLPECIKYYLCLI